MKSFKEYINEAHDIEDMAAGVHDEWMRRNPKTDYNAAQHVDYSDLKEPEKEKDREHINLALKLRQDNPRDPETDVKDHEERLAQRFGAIQHQSWRKGHESAKGVGAPRMKKVSDGPDVDINVPWEKLHPEWKRENLEAGRAAVGITGILKPREINEAKLEFKRKAFDADKLFGAGGKFDPADPKAPKERSFVTPKEPSAAQRLAAAKKPKKIKKPKNKSQNLGIDPRYRNPNGKFYKIDSPLHSSEDAHTESATETPDGGIMSFHNEELRHVATRKGRMVPLHILSRRIPDSVGTQFTIHNSNGGDAIHTYFHPDGGHYDEGPAGHFGEPVIDEENGELPGHTSHPDAPFRITHLHAENLIKDHLNNTIRNGKRKGLSVAEHHGIDED